MSYAILSLNQNAASTFSFCLSTGFSQVSSHQASQASQQQMTGTPAASFIGDTCPLSHTINY